MTYKEGKGFFHSEEGQTLKQVAQRLQNLLLLKIGKTHLDIAS